MTDYLAFPPAAGVRGTVAAPPSKSATNRALVLASLSETAGAGRQYAGGPGHLPLAITGGSLRSGRIAVDASRSSQFLSALLLAAPAVAGGLAVVSAAGVASAPYVETTLECLRAFGHEVSGSLAAPEGIRVKRGKDTADHYEVP